MIIAKVVHLVRKSKVEDFLFTNAFKCKGYVCLHNGKDHKNFRMVKTSNIKIVSYIFE